MKILWCASGLGTPSESPYDLELSTVASHRYRIGYPSRELQRMGHFNALLPLDALSTLPEDIDVDCAVFGKITAQGPAYLPPVAKAALAAAARLRARDVPIIVDICDFQLFPGDPRGEVVRQLIESANLMTCNSSEMAVMVKTALPDRPRPIVIPDPIELPRKVPTAPPSRRAVTSSGTRSGVLKRWFDMKDPITLGLLWFGHPTNLQYLLRLAPALCDLARSLRFRLTLCSSSHPSVTSGVEALHHEGHLDIRFVEWSMDSMAQTLADSDMVIIPSDPNDPAKRGAGSNRLVHALWSGRFVIANALPSYREFEDFAWIGDDLCAGIHWALNAPDEARKRIVAGQTKIASDFTIETIARRWLEVVTGIARPPKC